MTSKYEILYFKRKNKVHKGKGVSKLDGLLVVEKGHVKLYEGSNTDQPPFYTSYSSVNFNREFQIDEELDFGIYHAEVVRIIDKEKFSEEDPTVVPKSLSNSTRKPLISRSSSLRNNAIEPSKKTLCKLESSSRFKRPLCSSVTEGVENEDIDSLVSRQAVGKKLTHHGHSRLQDSKMLAISNFKQKKSSDSTSMPIESATLTLPNSIQRAIKPHQEDGVSFLWKAITGVSESFQHIAQIAGLDSAPRGAILADSMGTGKTLITISLIHALYRRNKQHRFIIVVPSSLIENWSKEFDKWLGRASLPKRIVVKKGGNECSQQIRSFNIVKPNQSEVLIISYDLFRVNSILLQDSKFIGLLVVDEGHRLKNSSGSMTLSTLESVKCDARLLITGTPIQNNLSEFYAVVNFVCPGILGSLTDFRRDFERPITTANRKDATLKDRQIGQEQVIALEVITKQFMLRRLAKDILSKSLPSRTELLIFCKPSALQCELYGGISENPDDPLSTLSKLRKLCAHPDLVQMSAEPHSTIFNLSDSGKLKVLELLLFEIRATHPDDKVVLVSNFTSVLSMIEERLVLSNGWGYHRLDGNTPQGARQAMVDSFNIVSPARCFIFLLSSKAGGLGLNLIGANRLIMFDADYNPAIDSQAMARIYRSGQLKSSIIYRLFTSGTLEETILQRQMQKGNLSCVTIDSSYSDNLSKFNEDDLRECFTLKDTPCDTKAKMNSIWPEFYGTKTLVQQGCKDQAILSLTEKFPDMLQYIYLQRENSENTEPEEIFGNSIQPSMAKIIHR